MTERWWLYEGIYLSPSNVNQLRRIAENADPTEAARAQDVLDNMKEVDHYGAH